jgi:hypothetical protein
LGVEPGGDLAVRFGATRAPATRPASLSPPSAALKSVQNNAPSCARCTRGATERSDGRFYGAGARVLSSMSFLPSFSVTSPVASTCRATNSMSFLLFSFV